MHRKAEVPDQAPPRHTDARIAPFEDRSVCQPAMESIFLQSED